MKALEILNNDNIFDENYVAENNYKKLINEAIKELEELQNRSCENCKYWHIKRFCSLLEIYNNIGGCGDYFEVKDK